MLWVRHQSKKGQHGGSLRLPEYAYVVRMSVTNLCDIGTSCKTTHKNIDSTAISNVIMTDNLLKHPRWILPLPQAVERPKQKGKKKVKAILHRPI